MNLIDTAHEATIDLLGTLLLVLGFASAVAFVATIVWLIKKGAGK